MTELVCDELFGRYVTMMNEDLAAAGGKVRIAAVPPGDPQSMTLLDRHGMPLGNVPTDLGLGALLAFETILDRGARAGQPLRCQGDPLS